MSELKKTVTYLLIVALFGIIIYQNPFCCTAVYSQETELKYLKQLGMKGIEKGRFAFPHSLAVDNLGNIYVGDTGNKRIQKFSPNGTFLTSWGSEGTGNGEFLGLHDVTVDPKGKFVYTVELKIIEFKNSILMGCSSQNGALMAQGVAIL